jgi:hypothetical protein
LLGSSVWRSTLVLLTWSVSATPSGRSLFRLRASAPPTSAPGASLWPTPQAFDANGVPNGNAEERRKKGGCSNLSQRIEGMYRTPNTMDGMAPKSQAALAHELEHRPGRTEPNNLRDQVACREGIRLWPTPRANCSTGAGEHGDGGPNLQTAVHLWPTATSRDWKDTGDCANVPVNYLLGRAVGPTKTHGSLDPAFVEYLQGFPIGWTDCDA